MPYGLCAMGLAKPVSLLDDPDERSHWAIRLLTDAWPIDSLFGPRPNRLPEGDPNLKKFVQLAQSDLRAWSVWLLHRPCSACPSLPGELAQALAGQRGGCARSLPAMVWYGITPLAEFDPEALAVVARATKWKIFAAGLPVH